MLENPGGMFRFIYPDVVDEADSFSHQRGPVTAHQKSQVSARTVGDIYTLLFREERP